MYYENAETPSQYILVIVNYSKSSTSFFYISNIENELYKPKSNPNIEN